MITRRSVVLYALPIIVLSAQTINWPTVDTLIFAEYGGSKQHNIYIVSKQKDAILVRIH